MRFGRKSAKILKIYWKFIRNSVHHTASWLQKGFLHLSQLASNVLLCVRLTHRLPPQMTPMYKKYASIITWTIAVYRVCWCLLNLLVVEFFVEYFKSQEIVWYQIHLVHVNLRIECVLHHRQDAILFITDKCFLQSLHQWAFTLPHTLLLVSYSFSDWVSQLQWRLSNKHHCKVHRMCQLWSEINNNVMVIIIIIIIHAFLSRHKVVTSEAVGGNWFNEQDSFKLAPTVENGGTETTTSNNSIYVERP